MFLKKFRTDLIYGNWRFLILYFSSVRLGLSRHVMVWCWEFSIHPRDRCARADVASGWWLLSATQVMRWPSSSFLWFCSKTDIDLLSLLCSLLNNCLSSSRSAIPARYFKRKLAPSLFEWTLQPKATTVAYHFVKIQIVFFFWMYKSSSQYDERLRQCLSITVHCFLKEKNDVMRLPEII